MTSHASRRGILKCVARVAALGALPLNPFGIASAREQTASRAGTVGKIDALLRTAADAGDLPGIVAMATDESGIFYEGSSGTRRLPDGAPMTRDTIFRVASMIKPITTVAAMQLVERGKLSLDAPAPPIEPALGAPQVLDGFDEKGRPQLRPSKRPILLRELLTHTSGFAYRLWDAKAVKYVEAVARLPAKDRKNLPPTPLMFDPGERWQYGGGLDWAGKLVEFASGEPLDVYFRQHIFDPLGMNDTAFVISPAQQAREASGHRRMPDGSLMAEPRERQMVAPHRFSGGGGIYSSAPDYLTFISALLHGGARDGVRILRPETVALMGRNQIGRLEAGRMRTTSRQYSNDVDFFPGISLKWGYGHMINMQPIPGGRSAGSLTWGGLFNTYYWIDPQKRIAAVFMTQVVPFADPRALAVYGAFERAIYAGI
ncbi:MAG TPA: serine hydrolase domain-containing protein [Xanthobacteraceae bacterium]|jgi:CubicO group peptidase (beta-lactamase class C family)